MDGNTDIAETNSERHVTNHEQPHLVTQAAQGWRCEGGLKTQRVTAFLTVYEVHRCYGGPEEGGWWYDAYEFTGAAFPFSAEQDYEARSMDWEDFDRAQNDGSLQVWAGDTDSGDDGPYMGWCPDGLPRVTDEATRVRLESARLHFIDLYGDPDGPQHRGSVRPKGPDYAFVYELVPGERGNRPRPRYC